MALRVERIKTWLLPPQAHGGAGENDGKWHISISRAGGQEIRGAAEGGRWEQGKLPGWEWGRVGDEVQGAGGKWKAAAVLAAKKRAGARAGHSHVVYLGDARELCVGWACCSDWIPAVKSPGWMEREDSVTLMEDCEGGIHDLLQFMVGVCVWE